MPRKREIFLLLLWPSNAVVFLPVGLFLAIVWQGRRHPVRPLGALLVSVVVAAGLLGEVVPLMNQAYRVRTAELLGGRSVLQAPGPNELTIGDLIRAVGPQGPLPVRWEAALRSFNSRAAILMWTASSVLLGTAVARARRRWRRAAVAIMSATFLVWVAAPLSAPLMIWLLALQPLAMLHWTRREGQTPLPADA